MRALHGTASTAYSLNSSNNNIQFYGTFGNSFELFVFYMVLVFVFISELVLDYEFVLLVEWKKQMAVNFDTSEVYYQVLKFGMVAVCM